MLAEAVAPLLPLFVNRLKGKHESGFSMKVANWRLWVETGEIILEIARGSHAGASDVQLISAQQNLVPSIFEERVKTQNE